MELTKEIVHKFFDIKDGLFYHKPREIRNGRDVVFNEKYAGKIAGHYHGKDKSVYKVSIHNKTYKVSDILDFLETGKFIVKTRDKPRFEALRFVERNNNIEIVGYQQWKGVISRLKNSSGYTGVNISSCFLDFDKYIEWAKNQKGFNCYDEGGYLYQIDKDLLSPIGNPTYSEDTCVFVPKIINLLCKPSRNSGFKKGVQYFPEKKKPYRSYINIRGKSKELGYYYSEDEANSKYIEERLIYLDEIQEQYKETVDERVWYACRDSRWW